MIRVITLVRIAPRGEAYIFVLNAINAMPAGRENLLAIAGMDSIVAITLRYPRSTTLPETSARG